MDFKPNEFFIGLVEFTNILLPGAVLALIVLMVEANHPVKDNHRLYQYAFTESTSIIFWVAIIFSSFGLGYFLSSIASGLVTLYDTIRKQFYPYDEDLRQRFKYNCLSERQKREYLKIYERSLILQKKKECAKEENFSNLTEKEKLFEGFKIKFTKNIFRILLSVIFKLDAQIKIDKSYEEARKILNTQPEAFRNATNAYKWANTVLEAHFPASSEQATRIVSASKFFRSMGVVSFIYLILQLSHQIAYSFWQINLLILLLSFREYIVQRQKSVQKTYQSIVVLTYYKNSNSEVN
ncbi:MAG: hypothetical protein SGJ02_02530 [bacterium]|nr:hypothetical protein [bacterium]